MSDGKKGRPANAWMGNKRGERAALLLRGLICEGTQTDAENLTNTDWVKFFLERQSLPEDPHLQKGAPAVTPFFLEVSANLEELSKSKDPGKVKQVWTETIRLIGVPELFSLLHASLAYIDSVALDTLDDSFLDGYWHPYYGDNCASSVRESLEFANSSWHSYNDSEVLRLKADDSFRDLMHRVQEASGNLAYTQVTDFEGSPFSNPSVTYHDMRILSRLMTEFHSKYFVPFQQRNRVVYVQDTIDETQIRQISQFVQKKKTGLSANALAVKLGASGDEIENSVRRVKLFLDDLFLMDDFGSNQLGRGHFADFRIVLYQLWLIQSVAHLRKQ
jgi:hypothetical protein